MRRCPNHKPRIVSLRVGHGAAVLACPACGKRAEKPVIACPDCGHLPWTQRGTCETCPDAIRGYVLAEAPEPTDCCYRPAVRRGDEEACANCARMMAGGIRHLIHGCDRTTPEEDERADDMAAAPPLEKATPMSERARKFADSMGW